MHPKDSCGHGCLPVSWVSVIWCNWHLKYCQNHCLQLHTLQGRGTTTWEREFIKSLHILISLEDKQLPTGTQIIREMRLIVWKCHRNVYFQASIELKMVLLCVLEERTRGWGTQMKNSMRKCGTSRFWKGPQIKTYLSLLSFPKGSGLLTGRIINNANTIYC